jgi:hypothetical protein
MTIKKSLPITRLYARGNLCWQVALEVDVMASKMLCGARNFPAFGQNGEEAFCETPLVSPWMKFSSTLQQPKTATLEVVAVMKMMMMMMMNASWWIWVVGNGYGYAMVGTTICGRYQNYRSRLLLPYFLAVGRRLLELAPQQRHSSPHHPDDTRTNDCNVDDDTKKSEGGTWVSTIRPNDRIEYVWGNAANTGLPDDYCHVVNLQFVAHELPATVTCEIIREAHRILKPNGAGELRFCEMDFESPG